MTSDEQRVLGRRSFVQESAAASGTFAAALAAFRAERAGAAAAAASPKPVGRPVNIAIIGSGNMGCGNLSQALKTPGVFVRAVCDVWPPNLAKGLEIGRTEKTYAGYRDGKDMTGALQAAKGAKAYDDYRKMLAEARDVEAVIVATPLHTHCQIATACIEAGKHVYSEKMMARTLEECRRLGKLAKASDKVVQFGHQQHWNTWYNLGYKLIRNDKVCGKITHIRAWWNRNRTWQRQVTAEDMRRIDATKYGYEDVNQLRNWRLFWSMSGGLMAELACHQIDVANWYTGSMPEAVVGMGGTDFRKDWGGEVYDNVQTIFRYPGGLKLIYQSITTNSYDGQGEQFMGTDGTVLLSRKGGYVFREPKALKLGWEKHAAKTKDARGRPAIVMKSTPRPEGGAKKQKGQAMPDADGKKPDPYHDYRYALADWITCIREGKRPKADWQVALRAAIPCILANEAMRKDQVIRIPPEMYQV